MKARPLTKIRPPPPKINSSPLKNGAWKTSFSYLGPGNFQGSYVKLRECTNNWNKETTQLATSMNLLPETASLQHFFCLKRLCFFFPCADHLVALLPKKWWCFLWPMEIHDALRAAISRSQLGWDFCLGARLLRWSRVAKGSLLKSWDSTERYLRCIYGPSKGWTVWLEDDGLINQKFEQHVFFFLAEIQNKACFQSFCPASFSLRWNW